MQINVKATEVEEANHPFYVIRYTIEGDGKELMSSVARYVSNKDSAKVQFLEPDMRKLLNMGIDEYLDKPIQTVVDEVVRQKGEEYIRNLH